jgi:penicillin-binding protein 2
VFKIVVAAAGLQEGILTPMDRVRCSGPYYVGGVTFKDSSEHGHGSIDLLRAINQSCNVYFYHHGLRIGGATIAHYATLFGLGKPTGVGFSGEKPGLIPEPRRPRTRRGAGWPAGDTVNMSIGQGRILVTPMQVARFMSAVANGGVLWRPRVVQRVLRSGEVVWSDGGEVAGHVELSPMIWAFLRQALWSAVNQWGTGAHARIPGLDVAGKTGTAQIIAKSRADKGEDHAWFASFAPARAPEVVVVVLVERGGKGCQVAAPIARKILNAIFLEKVAAVELVG